MHFVILTNAISTQKGLSVKGQPLALQPVLAQVNKFEHVWGRQDQVGFAYPEIDDASLWNLCIVEFLLFSY